MPVEPVTPPDRAAWRLMHLPVVLAATAAALLFVAASAAGLMTLGFQRLAHVPGSRYLVPLIAVMAVAAAYLMFVRLVERRPAAEELGREGAAREFGLGYGGGLLLALMAFAAICLLGGSRVVGWNSASVLLQPLVIQFLAAVATQFVICGLAFRSVERWLGSWLTLLLTMTFFGLVRYVGSDQGPLPIVAIAVEAGLLFCAPYMLTRRLWAAIGLAAGWKFAQIAMYGAATTPDQPHSLVRLVISGPDWLTGGPSGTDASLPAIVINLFALIALLTAALRRGRIVRPVWSRGRSHPRASSAAQAALG